MDWLIYGAYGFSGQLIAEEAVKRGYRPLLAGRSEAKLAALAHRLGLPYRAFSLDHLTEVTRILGGVQLVLNAAGPFIHTSDPMLKACTLAGVNYLDITGEYPVFERTFTFDEAARRQGIALISGVGFDVVPSDCLALHVAQQLPEADQLEVAIHGLTRMSVGTAQSGIELAAAGGRIRRAGKLVRYPLGVGVKPIRFANGVHAAMPIPWGDLATAYRSTGIPNITT
ncbi:MAG: saccharopine dehydrogenase NADP-binding domain-containing protein, partial [Anaerolineae bacterium]|nr:saccharopine dehydrogenase NADP-binding domain-containing protein [Anaerolineae bacterium]